MSVIQTRTIGASLHYYNLRASLTEVLRVVTEYGKWEAAWPPTNKQRQIIQFNARIAELVNKLRTQYGKMRLIKVHTSATLFHQDAQSRDLSEAGYNRIAYDLAEAIYDAAQLAWIDVPRSNSEETKTTLPSSPTTTKGSSPTSKLAAALAQTHEGEQLIGTVNSWNFYAQPATASSYDVCNPKTTEAVPPAVETALKSLNPTKTGSMPFPSGNLKIGTLGDKHTVSDCVYKGTGGAVGTLTCGDGAVTGLKCTEEADLPNKQVSANSLTDHSCQELSIHDAVIYGFKVLCTW